MHLLGHNSTKPAEGFLTLYETKGKADHKKYSTTRFIEILKQENLYFTYQSRTRFAENPSRVLGKAFQKNWRLRT